MVAMVEFDMKQLISEVETGIRLSFVAVNRKIEQN